MSAKPSVVVMAAPLDVFAQLHDKFGKVHLPVSKKKVASSRLVAGLEGAAYVLYVENVTTLQETVDMLLVLEDMVKDYRYNLQRRIQKASDESMTGWEQVTF